MTLDEFRTLRIGDKVRVNWPQENYINDYFLGIPPKIAKMIDE